MDSVTLAYQVGREKELTRLVSFDYGQRHKKELDCAALAAAALGVRHEVVDIANLARFLSGSALTDPLSVDVPDGHYAEDNMRTTVVPNRNAIMLAIAFGIAAGEGAGAVAFAVHAGDHFIYPDCRPAFVDAFRAMQRCALQGMDNHIRVSRPATLATVTSEFDMRSRPGDRVLEPCGLADQA
jgi:7-cyano-7-deazaguanine synthase